MQGSFEHLKKCLIFFLQEFSRLAEAMVNGRSTAPGPSPPNMINQQWSFLGPVVLDSVPSGARSLPRNMQRDDQLERGQADERTCQSRLSLSAQGRRHMRAALARCWQVESWYCSCSYDFALIGCSALRCAVHCSGIMTAMISCSTASPNVCAGTTFGDVVEDVAPGEYDAGSQVRAVFRSACPRNNVRLEGTFLTVERQNSSAPGGWQVVSHHILSACRAIPMR